ncbi:ranBP-type and C3HC4-type zinc finger-containing protein 1-like isoform X2 [Syngnathoides biaculeatus]|uniref:ranBP-type and C3HC4-type zinc finger-containing protein 1-like isoform X2 n=1 Tax=Syngnathoides biaculeatus TaxID=300417 RepID=UPI002ADD9D3B|nr:ranBP-type and C3HC4-type zinc finger-containing protein 1-like isoform X2 [Syngnathoides biaculeatus]
MLFFSLLVLNSTGAFYSFYLYRKGKMKCQYMNVFPYFYLINLNAMLSIFWISATSVVAVYTFALFLVGTKSRTYVGFYFLFCFASPSRNRWPGSGRNGTISRESGRMRPAREQKRFPLPSAEPLSRKEVAEPPSPGSPSPSRPRGDMALSSGGWAQQVSLRSSSQPGSCDAVPAPSSACCSTVLMSVRVSVSHSGIRPLRLPGADSDALRLQLSMDPSRAGEFRLALRDTSGNRNALVEFDLRSVHYEVKSARCHEMRLTVPPHDFIRFSFRCDREAEEWATVVTSSLREARRVANMADDDGGGGGQTQAAETSLPLAELCQELVKAVEAGDARAAAQHASALARQKAALSIQPAEKNYAGGEVSLSVVVEDVSSSCCFTVKVFPYMTVASLKQQVFVEYGFHPRVQRWVMGQCLCADARSLASYGVQRDGDTAYLYLISARQARITRQLFQQDLEGAVSAPPLLSGNGPASQDRRGYSTLPPRLPNSNQGGGDKPADLQVVFGMEHLQLNNKTARVQTEWACPSCTFINKASRPGCEICATAKPDAPKAPQQAACGEPTSTGS